MMHGTMNVKKKPLEHLDRHQHAERRRDALL